MALILLFLIVNIVIAWYFEQKKSGIVTVVHAVSFFVLLVFLLLASDYPYIVTAMQNIFGTELYTALNTAIFDSTHVLTIFAELEIVVAVLSVLVSFILIGKAVARIIRKWRDARFFCGPVLEREEQTLTPMRAIKILQLHCRQNC